MTGNGPHPDDKQSQEQKTAPRISITHGDKPTETDETVNAADSTKGDSTTGAGNGSGNVKNGSGNGATTKGQSPDGQTATRKKKKRRPPRRKRVIDRLVMEFQPDAVEMEHRKVAGGLRWTLYTAILLLISAVAWATWAKVDRIVVAEGKLVVHETIVIQPPVTSPIRSFNVRFGDTVRTGDVLITLDPTFSEADVAKLEAQINGLTASLTRLLAEQSGNEFSVAGHEDDPVWQTEHMLALDRAQELEARMAEFAAQGRKMEATRSKHESDVTELDSRLGHREELLRTIEGLYRKGSETRTEFLQNQIEVDFVKGQLVSAENSILETIADMESGQKEREAFLASRKAEVSTKLAEVRQQYAGLAEELNKARRSNELVTIKVPQHRTYDEFVVVEVAERSVGSVVQPGDALVRLIPVNAEREVECKVQSQDIARVRETEDGQPREVRIKLSAYPYIKHGTLTGRVRAISEDAFEEGQPPLVKTFYKVRVAIISEHLEDVPENYRLIPGMAATAEIKVGTRRVIEYFLYPLFRSLDSSIREP